MNRAWQKLRAALEIEYHWWRIRRLQSKQRETPLFRRRIQMHRFRAGQLSEWYEVLEGIRSPWGNIVG